MKSINVKTSLTMKIVSYIRHNLNLADFQEELTTLFDAISPRLKRECVDYMFESTCL